jgi:threonine synthase
VSNFYSTNLKAPPVSFREALLKGLAPDGGLYIPGEIPKLSDSGLISLLSMDYPAIATVIMGNLIGDEIDRDEIFKICNDIYQFSIPVETVYKRNYIMRLDQGPTASFKDFAAQFMGKIMQHFLNISNEYITILTATSGDTGSAVARAFYGLENIRAVILFPAGEVTEMQRKQMTTLNENIRAVEIRGKFDDCQSLVKKAFMDSSLQYMRLSSANSINVGRLLPQSVYYFWAWSRISTGINEPVVFSVPCGNFGNLAGGLIAKKMGLPVRKFIISTNSNNEVPEFLKKGEYQKITPSINCISSAMNVGHPSNLARIITFYGGQMDEKGNIIKSPDLKKMNTDFYSVSVSDDLTRETIEDCFEKYHIITEPHGAVAWYGLESYLKETGNETEETGCPAVSLETAHPGKFREEIERIIKVLPELPESLLKIENKNEEFISLENKYEVFKDFLIKNY